MKLIAFLFFVVAATPAVESLAIAASLDDNAHHFFNSSKILSKKGFKESAEYRFRRDLVLRIEPLYSKNHKFAGTVDDYEITVFLENRGTVPIPIVPVNYRDYFDALPWVIQPKGSSPLKAAEKTSTLDSLDVASAWESGAVHTLEPEERFRFGSYKPCTLYPCTAGSYELKLGMPVYPVITRKDGVETYMKYDLVSNDLVVSWDEISIPQPRIKLLRTPGGSPTDVDVTLQNPLERPLVILRPPLGGGCLFTGVFPNLVVKVQGKVLEPSSPIPDAWLDYMEDQQYDDKNLVVIKPRGTLTQTYRLDDYYTIPPGKVEVLKLRESFKIGFFEVNLKRQSHRPLSGITQSDSIPLYKPAGRT